jgi:NADH:ubiquinone oxidoreductase subunit K
MNDGMLPSLTGQVGLDLFTVKISAEDFSIQYQLLMIVFRNPDLTGSAHKG